MKNKWIFYTIIDIDDNGIYIKITEQSHRGKYFGDNSHRFYSSEGFSLRSVVCPEHIDDTCYVAGDDYKQDNNILIFDRKTFEKFRRAVDEYNLKYNSIFIIE